MSNSQADRLSDLAQDIADYSAKGKVLEPWMAGQLLELAAIAKQQASPEARAPQIQLNLGQARELVEFFGGDADCEVTLSQWTEGHEGPGLYAWCTEYPEEGSVLLDGNFTPPSAPQEPAVAQAALQVAARQASFALRELLPGNHDAQMTVRMLEDALSQGTSQAAAKADAELSLEDIALEECLQLGYTVGNDGTLRPPESAEWNALAASRLGRIKP